MPTMPAKPPAGTPALVALRTAGVAFETHEFAHEPGEKNYGMAAAVAIGADPEQVFKTLIALVDGVPHCAIVPVSGQLALKALAAAVGGKRAEMCPVEQAERMSGYVAGGISPFGQKRRLATAIDESALLFDTIFVSGGRRGLDIQLAPGDLIALLAATVADIATG